MELPVSYEKISRRERRDVREEYIRVQEGKCSHCGEPLDKTASSEVMQKQIDLNLFPEGFFDYPIHLHHCHNTGMTIGAVHCHCNAVLYQYYGE